MWVILQRALMENSEMLPGYLGCKTLWCAASRYHCVHHANNTPFLTPQSRAVSWGGRRVQARKQVV